MKGRKAVGVGIYSKVCNQQFLKVDSIPCDDDTDMHTAGEYLGREQSDNIITTRYRCDDCDKIIEDVYVEERVGERIIDEEKKEYSEDFG